jgi:hypothetical protein
MKGSDHGRVVVSLKLGVRRITLVTAAALAVVGGIMLAMGRHWGGVAMALAVLAVLAATLHLTWRGPQRSEDTRRSAGEAGP